MKSIITQEGLINLKEKLRDKKELLKKVQEEKAHAYTASGDGWHDNPGWTQLGQQEEMVAAEVMKLEHSISNAKIIDKSKLDTEKVQIGCKVHYTLLMKSTGKTSEHMVIIVGIGETDIKNSKVSYDSPIGKALYNLRLGEEIEVSLPNGVVVLKVKSICYE
jgi:transcription elongation factor GreA